MMNDEPTLTRIRNARQRISAACGHDPYKLVEHYLQYQKQYQDRLIPKVRNNSYCVPEVIVQVIKT
jgi:hypothetical protein